MSCAKKAFAPFPNDCPYAPEIKPDCGKHECMFHEYTLADYIQDDRPLVSVIVPIHNAHPDTLRRTIQSIMRQTFKPFEIVLVNDGSTVEEASSYEEVFYSFSNKNNKVIFMYEEQEHYGQAHARNTGFIRTSGNYIAYLDVGDEWLPDHLHSTLLIMYAGDVQFCFGGFSYYHEEDGLFEVHEYDDELIKEYKYYLQIANFINTCTVVHTDKLFIAAGGFEEGVVCGEDGVLWRRMSEITKFGYNPNECVHYFKNGRGQSAKLKEPKKIAAIHLIGNGTNGQELDDQDKYEERVKRFLKNRNKHMSKKLRYIDID